MQSDIKTFILDLWVGTISKMMKGMATIMIQGDGWAQAWGRGNKITAIFWGHPSRLEVMMKMLATIMILVVGWAPAWGRGN